MIPYIYRIFNKKLRLFPFGNSLNDNFLDFGDIKLDFSAEFSGT